MPTSLFSDKRFGEPPTESRPEFHVENEIFGTFNEAAGYALTRLLSGARAVATIDVVCWDRSAARLWAGDEGVAQYDEDPEASVFERIQITANSLGRVP